MLPLIIAITWGKPWKPGGMEGCIFTNLPIFHLSIFFRIIEKILTSQTIPAADYLSAQNCEP
jgi:hypothetical protein